MPPPSPAMTLTPVQPLLPSDPAAEAWADERLASDSRSPVVLINPGAGWGAKRWPVERYADVARATAQSRLSRSGQCRAGRSVSRRHDFQEDWRRRDSAPLFNRATHCHHPPRELSTIAGDTGPLHLACALGRPVVGIYGPTDPSRNGPYGTRFKVLRSPESRRDHTRHEAPEAGLLTITAEDVLQAADELLYSESAR